jgi:hypothetical protein
MCLIHAVLLKNKKLISKPLFSFRKGRDVWDQRRRNHSGLQIRHIRSGSGFSSRSGISRPQTVPRIQTESERWSWPRRLWQILGQPIFVVTWVGIQHRDQDNDHRESKYVLLRERERDQGINHRESRHALLRHCIDKIIWCRFNMSQMLKAEAVFLVVSDPSRNKLWAT